MLKCRLVWSSIVPVLKDCSSRGRCWLSHPSQRSARVGQDAAVFLPLQGRRVAGRLHLCKMPWVGRDVQIGHVVWAWVKKKKKHVKNILSQPGKISNLLKKLECGCLSLTSMRVKDASHCVPTLCPTIEGRFSTASGWHCILCFIWHRWDLSCWVHCSIRVYPIKSKDHSGIPGSCGFLSSYCVVLWGCISCLRLQESGRGSAVRQWDTLYKLKNILYITCYTVEVYLNRAPAALYFC